MIKRRKEYARPNILFPGSSPVEGLLSRERREQVERVIQVGSESGLSYPLLQDSEVLTLLPENFPNAKEFIVYSNIAQLFRPPPGKEFTLPEKPFHEDYPRLIESKEKTLLLFTNYRPDREVHLFGCSGVRISMLGFREESEVAVMSADTITETPHMVSAKGSNVQERQHDILRHMGFEGTLRPGERFTLTGDKLSDQVLETKEALWAKIPGGAARPLIVWNPLVGYGGVWPQDSKGSWMEAGRKIMGEVDANIVLNDGPPHGG